jgi:hypothetical protein
MAFKKWFTKDRKRSPGVLKRLESLNAQSGRKKEGEEENPKKKSRRR